MYRILLSLILISVIGSLSTTSIAFAGNQDQSLPDQAAKIKASIAKLGSGPRARAKIKLRDSTKLEGYVREVREDSFELVEKTGNAKTLRYDQVAQIGGTGLSKAARIAIGIPLALGAVILAGVLLNAGRD